MTDSLASLPCEHLDIPPPLPDLTAPPFPLRLRLCYCPLVDDMKGGQTKNARLNAVGALCLVLLWTQILAEETKWKESMTAATQALQQRRYTQAEQLLLAALREAKDFGEQDSRLATTLNRLAELYRLQRKYEQAEPLYQRALKIREKALGPEHPDVATTLNNLAFLYAFQDSPKAPLGHKYGQAEPLYQRALAIREKSLGPEHPSVASTLFNLAWLYGRQAYRTEGKHEQAEPLHQRALTIWEKTLGPEHPNVARSLNALASLYYDQGKYEQAEPLYQRLFVDQREKLGTRGSPGDHIFCRLVGKHPRQPGQCLPPPGQV